MATETTEQIIREDPLIEAYKLGLLADAVSLAQQPVGVPQYDAEGNMIMEPAIVDPETGEVIREARPLLQLPRQQIAAMTPLQREALAQAAGGIGEFRPFLEGAAGTLGQAQLATAGATAQAQPFQTRAAEYLDAAGQGVGTQVSGAQQGITSALRTGLGDTRAAQRAAAQAATGLGTRGREIVGQLGADLAPTTGISRALAGQAGQQIGQATLGGLGAYGQALAGVQDVGRAAEDVQRQAREGTLLAVDRGRAITGQAATDLARAGRFGMGTAARGIANLFGSTGEFDPAAAERFMNPFEQQVVDQTLADIARQGEIQRQQQRAQAVAAGAFGGARSGIMESELGRNILEQQAKAAAQLRRAGFESASQRAQQAFEEQQRRQQQASQLTGALGAQGSQAAARAAQAAGGLGLSAEQLATQGEGLAARTGLQAQQLRQAGALSGGQLGLAAQSQAAQNAAKAAQLGLTAEQFAAANAQSLASTGLSLEQAAAQTGLSAAQLAGRLGQNIAQMGIQGAQASGQLGLQGLGMQADIGKGIAALGSDVARLNLEQGRQLGTLGLQQGSLGELGQNLAQREQGFLFDLGKREQAQNQAVLEAQRANQMAQIYEPYQRLGFVSDIYKGAPTSQMSVTASSSPNVSPAQTFLGLGVAGLSAAAGARNAGLFG